VNLIGVPNIWQSNLNSNLNPTTTWKLTGLNQWVHSGKIAVETIDFELNKNIHDYSALQVWYYTHFTYHASWKSSHHLGNVPSRSITTFVWRLQTGYWEGAQICREGNVFNKTKQTWCSFLLNENVELSFKIKGNRLIDKKERICWFLHACLFTQRIWFLCTICRLRGNPFCHRA